MQKRILNLYFNINLSLPVTVILEPSEVNWDIIFNNTINLIKNLPGRIDKIYFLGNKKEYKIFIPKNFEENSSGWLSENVNRPLLIGQILDNLSNENKKRNIVVILSNDIIDIKDWENTEIFKWMVLFNIKEERLIDVKKIENQITSIYIKNKDFVPLAFEIKSNQSKPFVNYINGEFTLIIKENSEQLEGHLKVICSDDQPKLFIQRIRGNPESIQLQLENTWFNEPEWKNVPDNLLDIIDSVINKKDFKCPYCNTKHNYKTLICPEGGTILSEFPLNTLILIKNNKYLPIIDWFAFPLRNNETIITREGILYDWTNGKWEKRKIIELYEEVDDGIWGLFHRI